MIAKENGSLVPQPCEVCGNQNSEAHHADYDKPLEVRWLCQEHHQRLHHGKLELDKVLPCAQTVASPMSKRARRSEQNADLIARLLPSRARVTVLLYDDTIGSQAYRACGFGQLVDVYGPRELKRLWASLTAVVKRGDWKDARHRREAQADANTAP
jgi:hypothetical protein